MEQNLNSTNKLTLIEALKEVKRCTSAQKIKRIIEINGNWYLEYGS